MALAQLLQDKDTKITNLVNELENNLIEKEKEVCLFVLFFILQVYTSTKVHPTAESNQDTLW